MGGAVEMCSGLGVCRKTLEGTMCPSYMATKEESHTTRGRANVLRLAMAGKLGSAGLDDRGVYDVLDLCLECRACKAECPVGVDMARFKSEFLAGYWQTYGTPLHAQMLGNVRTIAKLGSPFASMVNWVQGMMPVRMLNEAIFGIDHRRTLPALSRKTFASRVRNRNAPDAGVLLFNDTFTNYYDPEIGVAVWDVLEAAGLKVAMAPNRCCGRPLISKGLLRQAREQSRTKFEVVVRGRVERKEDRFLRAKLSFRGSRGRAVPSQRRGPAQGASRCRCLCALRRIRQRPPDPAEARAAEDPAARPLSSEIDGPFAGRERASRKNPRLHGDRSRCGMLWHGGLFRLFEGSLRGIAPDRRKAASPAGSRPRIHPRR